MAIAQTYLLALAAALYLLRGMIEAPAIGWRTEVKATAVIGVILLPVMAALAAAAPLWGDSVIACLSVVGLMINAIALIRFWRGLTSVAGVTMVIIAIYAAVTVLAAL